MTSSGELGLGETRVSGAGLRTLASLRALQKLGLSGADITMTDLRQLVTFPSLQTVEISDSIFDVDEFPRARILTPPPER